jgi:hypothetical protein
VVTVDVSPIGELQTKGALVVNDDVEYPLAPCVPQLVLTLKSYMVLADSPLIEKEVNDVDTVPLVHEVSVDSL